MTVSGARIGGRPALFVAALVTISGDRLTKLMATRALAGLPSRSFFGDTLRLGYVENSGGFLGLGADLPATVRASLFIAATGLMLLALVVIAVRRRWGGWTALGLTLFVTGGASNWIDRVVRGSVVDFLNVGIGPVRTGVFNVADVAIMVGAAIFIIAERRRHRAVGPAQDEGNGGL